MTKEVEAIEKLFFIKNKRGKKVPFIINKAQWFLDKVDNPLGKVRILIAKARQKGFSAFVLAKLGIRCLGQYGTAAVCMSHESHATQRLLDRVDYYMKHMRGPQPSFGRHSRTEMFFEKMDSTFYIGTAGAKTFGRGDTVTDLHCSEYAWWEGARMHHTGVFQAVPKESGRIYIESTGNGRNNDFYYMWENAEEMGYKRLFYPWFADEEYSTPLPNTMMSWKPSITYYAPYLLEMKAKHNLTDEQMYWYENTFKELRESLPDMQQEYPSEPEECFQAKGGTIFPTVKLSISKDWDLGHFGGYVVAKHNGHPKKGFHYVMGIDPSGGTGNDDAAIVVFCVETFEQVFELFNKGINPIDIGELGCKIGDYYNKAFITCESNNHGAATVPYLVTNYDRFKLYKRRYGTKTTSPQYGWNNTDTTKHALVGVMQEMIDDVTFYGVQTVKELKKFEEDEKGKMGSDSDNLVIASGLGMLGLRKYEYLRKDFVKPRIVVKQNPVNYMQTSYEQIFEDLKKNKGDMDDYIISPN